MHTARFPIELGLPEGNSSAMEEAARAVNSEYLNSVRVKRLQSLRVEAVGNGSAGLYAIEVGAAVQFDWTWEGAVAFRPPWVDASGKDWPSLEDLADYEPQRDMESSAGVWAGEVVEVDQAGGRVFVNVTESGQHPTTGTFFVKPFEFLLYLRDVYRAPAFVDLQGMLPARLRASEGAVHPSMNGDVSPSLSALAPMWGHTWSILWGPPGTGKTFTIGRQLAECSRDSAERILVVSTTNAATDEAALSIGAAVTETGREIVASRIGKGADYNRFADKEMEWLLRDTETDLLRQIAGLLPRLRAEAVPEERALIRYRIQELRRKMADTGLRVFMSPDTQVTVTTAFNAMRLLAKPEIADAIADGYAPFTTVIIDEAGLLSRATVAALSLLAARRVMLVGDPRQLAPISKVSRVLPPAQARWMARSGLSHLARTGDTTDAVHLLREQHRMHPHIRDVVSQYQYDGTLTDGSGVVRRHLLSTALLDTAHSRAVWYVLDEDAADLPSIRALRGPGNRSWLRPATRLVLDKFFADPDLVRAQGLFISPFAAQARDIAGYLQRAGAASWSAGTVHSQQGVGVDVVVFDTVNAGSCGWPYEEWKRIINVGLSRAKQFAILLASRDEMREPYLRPLRDTLSPCTIMRQRGMVRFEPVLDNGWGVDGMPGIPRHGDSSLLGHQLELRKALRPLMSHEQQQLVNLNMDGKPRLVRGVAGSGKTVVLANWLEQVVLKLSGDEDSRVWAVFANRALEGLIKSMIDDAWRRERGRGEFPWDRVSTLHVRDVLDQVSIELNLAPMQRDDYEYNGRAALLLARAVTRPVKPRCAAMFIDEAQDMGMDTLKLLAQLVSQSDPMDPKSRAIHIFYDNAQDIYGRGTPKWSEIGLDMRGRSTVMKESFRSTLPITEFALNVLYRLRPPDDDPDYRELIERGLVEPTTLDGADWWLVRFNQVDGPPPSLRRFASWDEQVSAIADQTLHWIQREAVEPGDVVVICNAKKQGEALSQHIAQRIAPYGASHFATSQELGRTRSSVLVTTPHSFKGHDSEIVIIAGVDDFTAGHGRILLANNLYVAMTRARSTLQMYSGTKQSGLGRKITDTVAACLDALGERRAAEAQISPLDAFEQLVEAIGTQHRKWLADIGRRVRIQREPLRAKDGEILAEPLFWFTQDDQTYVCFAEPVKTRRALTLDALGVRVINPGDDV